MAATYSAAKVLMITLCFSLLHDMNARAHEALAICVKYTLVSWMFMSTVGAAMPVPLSRAAQAKELKKALGPPSCLNCIAVHHNSYKD